MARSEHTPISQPIFHEPQFSENGPTPSPTGFSTKHPSDNKLYSQIEDLLTKDVVSIPKSRAEPDELYSLEAAYGAHGLDVVKAINANGKIIFHAFGDSGASSTRKYSNELKVADQVTADASQSDHYNTPAFLFHLGDVVYNFGESRYYYDQFYEPFRNYPAPIFAIAGNHDSFVVPDTPAAQTPLKIFARNFCAEHPAITKEAGSLHRTAMTQPGIYFTLDAPFVRIIGLFSNALEDPGLISGQDGKWPHVSDIQLEFLAAQLKLIKDENYQGAVLLAVHHPPFSYSPPAGEDGEGGNHGSSPLMLADIDRICAEQGVYPHAVLSGHAHNYQRYTRIIEFEGQEIDVPFIICGDGGHNVNPLVRGTKGKPAQEPHAGSRVDYLESNPVVTVKQLIIEKYDDKNYGYLRVHVDKEQLKIGFHQVGVGTLAQSRYDMVTVDLASRTMIAN